MFIFWCCEAETSGIALSEHKTFHFSREKYANYAQNLQRSIAMYHMSRPISCSSVRRTKIGPSVEKSCTPRKVVSTPDDEWKTQTEKVIGNH